MKKRISSVKVDCSKISNTERKLLASTILDAVNRFYDDPVNVKKFNEWLPKYQERKAAMQSTN